VIASLLTIVTSWETEIPKPYILFCEIPSPQQILQPSLNEFHPLFPNYNLDHIQHLQIHSKAYQDNSLYLDSTTCNSTMRSIRPTAPSN
jgi:hypothetical protein